MGTHGTIAGRDGVPAGARRHASLVALTLVLLLALSTLSAGCGGGSGSGDKAKDSKEAAKEAKQDKASKADKPAKTEATFPVNVTDDAKRSVTVPSKPERIVSLAPANTEILAAIGLLSRLVGVTTYDDYPAEVTSLPKVGDFVNPNIEAIGAAEPDLIVATTGVQADVLKKLEDLGAVVLAIDPTTLEGLYRDIDVLGKATGQTAEADKLVKSMKKDVAEVFSAVKKEEPVSVFVEIGQDPLFTVGSQTLIDEMLRAAGGENVVTQPGYVAYSLEQLVQDDPAVYMATKGSMSDPSDLKKRPGYNRLGAVGNGEVYLLDDNLVTRPGPRVVEGIRAMAEAMHPEAFEE